MTMRSLHGLRRITGLTLVCWDASVDARWAEQAAARVSGMYRTQAAARVVIMPTWCEQALIRGLEAYRAAVAVWLSGLGLGPAGEILALVEPERPSLLPTLTGWAGHSLGFVDSVTLRRTVVTASGIRAVIPPLIDPSAVAPSGLELNRRQTHRLVLTATRAWLQSALGSQLAPDGVHKMATLLAEQRAIDVVQSTGRITLADIGGALPTDWRPDGSHPRKPADPWRQRLNEAQDLLTTLISRSRWT